MPKIVPQKYQEVIHKLKKIGYVGPIFGGRHAHMKKGNKIIPIPMHGGKEIGVGLICMIIKEIGISREEWIKL